VARALGVEVYLTLEFADPGGVAQGCAGLRMICSALECGELTSGNTGGARTRGLVPRSRADALVMPATVSKARSKITTVLSTELLFSSPMEDADGAICMVCDLVRKD